MHELALMEDVVAAIEARTQPARVTGVWLEIGRLSGVVPDAMRFCFDAVARETTLEGASLRIDEVPGRARCRDCGAERALESFLDLCDGCGGASLEVLAGQELVIKRVEVQ